MRISKLSLIASLIALARSLPANVGSSGLSRREVQTPDTSGPGFDGRGYPDGWWDQYHHWRGRLLPAENQYASDAAKFKEAAPRYPFGKPTKSEPVPDRDRSRVEKANQRIDDCWAWWVGIPVFCLGRAHRFRFESTGLLMLLCRSDHGEAISIREETTRRIWSQRSPPLCEGCRPSARH